MFLTLYPAIYIYDYFARRYQSEDQPHGEEQASTAAPSTGSNYFY
jgi:hypothetical protein